MDYVSSSSLSLSLSPLSFFSLDSSSKWKILDRGARLNCPGITAIYLEGGGRERERKVQSEVARGYRRRSAVDQKRVVTTADTKRAIIEK